MTSAHAHAHAGFEGHTTQVPPTPPGAHRDHIKFSHGMPGFEACRGFVLVASESLGPLQCLRAVEGPPASFLVIDPRRVVPDYRCDLSDSDRRRLGASADDTLLWLAIVTIDLDGTITANLRAPIVIHPTRMVGEQLVTAQCIYPIRYVIADAE
jgi:flagellar assembly factor FliW